MELLEALLIGLFFEKIGWFMGIEFTLVSFCVGMKIVVRDEEEGKDRIAINSAHDMKEEFTNQHYIVIKY